MMFTIILQLLFWMLFLIVFYIYIGYPLILTIITTFYKRKRINSEFIPAITILIPAYNESAVIEQTIMNKIKQDYPLEKIQIIVISDESDDGTDEIVTKLAQIYPENLKLLRQAPRRGKTAAVNLAVKEATGEILIFSDANSLYERQALKKLCSNFSDPGVGYVTGKMVYVQENNNIVGDGCSAYMKYENFLRSKESQVGSIVGVDGGIDAMRKSLYQPLNDDQLPDFAQPLSVIKKGYRVVYESEAILMEKSLGNVSDEFKMRVRVTLRAYWALWDFRSMFINTDNLLFSWQLFSHKLLRYLAFIPLILLFISNLFLLHINNYLVLFICQIFFYSAGIIQHFFPGISVRSLKFCHYFLLLNLSALIAFVKFLMGEKQIVWKPRLG